MTSTEGEGREKNYGWKSAFFLQYPSMFDKVLWRFRGAMTGSRMSVHLSMNRRQTAAEDINNLCINLMCILFQIIRSFCVATGHQKLQLWNCWVIMYLNETAPCNRVRLPVLCGKWVKRTLSRMEGGLWDELTETQVGDRRMSADQRQSFAAPPR